MAVGERTGLLPEREEAKTITSRFEQIPKTHVNKKFIIALLAAALIVCVATMGKFIFFFFV